MHKKQLEQIKHHIQAAIKGSDFSGLFTAEIRTSTVAHRKDNIFRHLEIALATVDTELKRCDKKIEQRRVKAAKRAAVASRLPYKDD